ncbi:MAG TPA: polyprenyl synthetase family protein [Kineosporiaceae bacterium]|nr:polyprenyl synthetase family protein [Kineosporiaceae bacterium]
MTSTASSTSEPSTTAHPLPLDAEDLRSRVDATLADFLAAQARTLTSVSPDCHELVESVISLMRGGKRLRPAFCYWGWRGAGGDNGQPIVAAAAALELFQAAALIHDDLMDGSDTRRGMPAVHRRFAGLHRAGGWQGDSDGFGLAGAVLAGDICLVWTDELFAGSGLTVQQLASGRAMFNRMRTELLGGQYLDVLTQAAPEGDPQAAIDRARQVIRFKSAKYTVEHPLLIGASLAGADSGLMAVYSEYGLALGEAFQLRDDVLGVFGDPQQTGKPAGDDLREGKRTVLVGLTLQGADQAQTGAVRRLLGDPRLDAEGVATLRTVMVETGALERVECLIDELADQALRALNRAGTAGVEVAEPAREVLSSLVVAATARAT